MYITLTTGLLALASSVFADGKTLLAPPNSLGTFQSLRGALLAAVW